MPGGFSQSDAWRLHPPQEWLEFGNKQSFPGREQPWAGDRHRVGEASGAPCPEHNPPLITRKVSMCWTFQEALLGSPVNHSQWTLRRQIWAVYNSVFPAVCWAQTLASGLLLVHQENALGGLLCLGTGHVNSWQSRVLSPPLLSAVEAKTLLKCSFF